MAAIRQMREMRDEMNPRTCIVSRQARDADELIRFVCDPADRVVPDLKCRLPGRGVWVTAARGMVDEAVRKRLFARGFKHAATADDDLGGMVDRLLEEEALAALSLARKAGLVRTGTVKVEGALRSGEVVLLLHAADGAAGGIRKLDQAARVGAQERGMPVIASPFTASQMDLALGGANVIHAAAMKGGATDSLIRHVARLQRYRQPEAVEEAVE